MITAIYNDLRMIGGARQNEGRQTYGNDDKATQIAAHAPSVKNGLITT